MISYGGSIHDWWYQGYMEFVYVPYMMMKKKHIIAFQQVNTVSIPQDNRINYAFFDCDLTPVSFSRNNIH